MPQRLKKFKIDTLTLVGEVADLARTCLPWHYSTAAHLGQVVEEELGRRLSGADREEEERIRLAAGSVAEDAQSCHHLQEEAEEQSAGSEEEESLTS